MQNPFKQSPEIWMIEVILYYKDLDYIIGYFDSISDAVSYFEYEETADFGHNQNDVWCVTTYFEYHPDVDKIKADLGSYLKFDCRLVENEDWVTKTQADFKPIIVKDFFVHNSFYKDHPHQNLIPIHIDAGRAFGTGSHETTSSCLDLISSLKCKPQNSLDVGSGSGILAIAIAKKYATPIIATDIDNEAANIIAENIAGNNVASLITPVLSNGYEHLVIVESGPYDLITANILAQPLIAMAADLAKNLTPNGYAILSGFLESQEHEVLEAHYKHGLKLVDKIRLNNWCTVLMQKQ